MHYNNPFGSWANGGQTQPSIFGALPYPTIPPPSNLVTFHLTSFSPNVLNCTVVGPHGQTYYHIVTDKDMPGYTVLRDSSSKNVGLIEWQAVPSIEVRGVVSKTGVKNWLRLSPDRSARIMEVRGMQYVWAPKDKHINLYTGVSAGAFFLARISREQGYITLEITSDAIQLGLLDTTVVAALLLQCGRNID